MDHNSQLYQLPLKYNNHNNTYTMADVAATTTVNFIFVYFPEIFQIKLGPQWRTFGIAVARF